MTKNPGAVAFQKLSHSLLRAEKMQSNLKKVAGNAGALLAIQIANYLLPFVLAPYLTRTLGIAEYGIVALGLSIIQISGIITDYGFSISATYMVAKASSKPDINYIAGAVYTCKAILLIPVIIFIYSFPLAANKYIEHKEYFWLISLSILGIAFQPTWLFQGLEKMKLITLYTVFSRVLLIALTIIFVKEQGDAWIFAICNGLSQIAATAISIYSLKKIGYSPKWKSLNYALTTFRESTEYFWSRAAVGTYGAGAIFVLGLISTPIQVAYYSVAEQFYRGALALYSPLTQALYPHMAKHRDLSIYRKIFTLVLLSGVLGITTGILLGKPLISFIFGETYTSAYPVLVIFMISLGAAIPSIMLGYPLLGALGNSKAANYSVMYAGLLQVALIIFCASKGFTQAINIVTTVLISEIFAFSYRAYFAKRIFNQFKLEARHAKAN